MCEETSKLRLFLDSAREKDWQKYLPLGIFYGVTTNPKLLGGAGINFKIDEIAKLANKAFELGAKEIHIQVWGREANKMLIVGRELTGIDPKIAVKVPITPQGLACARPLIEEGAHVTLTAVHSAKQALIAICLKAGYAAPYLGRMQDGGLDGIAEVVTMDRIVRSVESPIRLLVASIRQTSDLITLAKSGLNTFTLSPPIVDELIENELTQEAAEAFESEVQLN